MKLTEEKIKNAPLLEKPYKIADGKGVYLLVKPTGVKLFRMRYRLHGLEYTHSFGNSDFISLTEVRAIAEKIYVMAKRGEDPKLLKKGKNEAVKIRIRDNAAPINSTPIKLLRLHVEHLEAQREHIESKKRDIEQQLDYVSWDLNEILGFIDQTNMAIRHLEGNKNG